MAIVKKGNTLQDIVLQNDLPAAPTSPTSATAFGATPKSRDMAGSPAAQKANVKRIAEEGQTYQEFQTQRETERATQGPETDARTQELMERAAQATLLVPGLQALSQAGLQYALNQRGGNYQVGVDQAAANKEGVNQNDLQTLLNSANPAERASAWGRVNEAIGDQELTPDMLAGFYTGDVDDVIDFVTGDVLNAVSVEELVEDMDADEMKRMYGFDSLAELEEFFGRDVSQISVSDLDDYAQTIRSEYDSSGKLFEILNDPKYGPEERQAAQERLRDLGFLGYRAAEEKMNNLVAQMEDSDLVTFNGETMEISKVLSDEYLSGVIKDALEDEKKLAELEKSDPAFGGWIRNNKESLSELTTNLDEASSEYANTVKELQNLTDFGDNALMSLEAMFPGFDPRSGTKPELPPLYTALKDYAFPSATNKVEVITQLEAILTNPDLADQAAELRNMSADQIRRLGLLTKPADVVAKLTEYNKDFTDYQLFKDEPDEFINSLFDGASFDSIQQILDEYREVSGGELPDEWKKFDKDGDGQLDIAENPKGFMRDVANGLFQGGGKRSLQDILTTTNTINKLKTDLADIVANGGNKIAIKDTLLTFRKEVGFDFMKVATPVNSLATLATEGQYDKLAAVKTIITPAMLELMSPAERRRAETAVGEAQAVEEHIGTFKLADEIIKESPKGYYSTQLLNKTNPADLMNALNNAAIREKSPAAKRALQDKLRQVKMAYTKYKKAAETRRKKETGGKTTTLWGLF